MNEKINKLATQHKEIGAKTDCPYFSTIGRLCSRVENGMMRCDEYLECEFKYIDTLEEENKQMKERLNNCEKFFNELGELLNEEVGNAYWTQAILHKIKKLIEINHELAEEHKTIGQDLYAEIKEYRKEKENLKTQLEIDKNQINYFIEENEKQKEQIKQLEDFIKSAGEIDHINHEYTYKLKKVLQEIKQLVSTDYIKTKKQLVQNYDCLDNFMQKIEDKCNEVQQ